MIMRNYRNAFVFALVGNLALLAVLGGLWWRGKQHRQMEVAMQPTLTESAQSSPNGSESAAMAPHEAALVPVQLSPERLQSIGVRTGRVEIRTVEDEIHVTGNVAIGGRNGAAQTMGRPTTGDLETRIYRCHPAGTPGRFTRLWLYH